jgi:hypothetical protein
MSRSAANTIVLGKLRTARSNVSFRTPSSNCEIGFSHEFRPIFGVRGHLLQHT